MDKVTDSYVNFLESSQFDWDFYLTGTSFEKMTSDGLRKQMNRFYDIMRRDVCMLERPIMWYVGETYKRGGNDYHAHALLQFPHFAKKIVSGFERPIYFREVLADVKNPECPNRESQFQEMLKIVDMVDESWQRALGGKVQLDKTGKRNYTFNTSPIIYNMSMTEKGGDYEFNSPSKHRFHCRTYDRTKGATAYISKYLFKKGMNNPYDLIL